MIMKSFRTVNTTFLKVVSACIVILIINLISYQQTFAQDITKRFDSLIEYIEKKYSEEYDRTFDLTMITNPEVLDTIRPNEKKILTYSRDVWDDIINGRFDWRMSYPESKHRVVLLAVSGKGTTGLYTSHSLPQETDNSNNGWWSYHILMLDDIDKEFNLEISLSEESICSSCEIKYGVAVLNYSKSK